MSNDAKAVSAIDRHVGEQVRRLRLEARLSQQALAAELGITFQQVQKYENGTNRISAGRLQTIAALLGVPIDRFYGSAGATGGPAGAGSPAADADARELVAMWTSLPPEVRSQIVALTRAVKAALPKADGADGADGAAAPSRLKARVASLTLR